MLFWKNWPSPYKQFLYAGMLIILAAIGFAIYFFSVGYENVIPLRIETELESIIVPYDTFYKNHLQWIVEGTAFISNSRYVAGGITVNNFCAGILLVLMITAVTLYLTFITSLPRYYFLGGILLFMLFFVKLEYHVLLETKFYLPAVLLSFGLTAYLFHAFFPSTSHVVRFLIFFLLNILAGYFAFSGNNLLVSLQYTVNNVLPVLIISSILLIVYSSAEVINLITYLSTCSGNPEKRAGKYLFLMFGTVYCLFMLLYYIKISNFFGDFPIFPSPIFLLLLNIVIGFFSFNFKINSINKLSPYRIPFMMVYISFSIITLGTLSFLYGTENDSLYRGFENHIIFSQFSFSWVYFMFIGANFYKLFEKKLQVWKVVFKPHQSPVYLYLLLGITVFSVVIVRSGYSGYYQFKSGTKTAMADLYWEMNNKPMAGEMYKDALMINTPNAKALYGNALIKIIQNDPIAARVSLEQEISKVHSPYIYIQISELFLNNKNFFEGLFSLRDGLKKFPENPALRNNLALLYEKTGLTDSACYYLNQNINPFTQNKLALPNLLSIYTKYKLETEGKELISKNKKISLIPAFETNKLAFQSLLGIYKPATFEKKFFHDFNLDNNNFCYLYNYGVYHLKHADDSISYLINKYSQKAIFKFHSENLDFLEGVMYYYKGQVEEGKNRLLAVSRNGGTYEGMSNDILGKWMYEQGAYELSADYFKRNVAMGDTTSIFHYCESIMESGKFEEAKSNLAYFNNSKFALSAKLKISLMDSVYNAPVNELDDMDIARKIHLWLNVFSDEKIMSLYYSIRENKARLSASAELIRHFLNKQDLNKANLINEKISWIKNDNSDLYQDYYLAKLWLDFKQKKYKDVLNNLKTIKPNRPHRNEYYYLLAKTNLALNNQIKGEQLLEKIVNGNPFYVKALLDLAIIYEKKQEELKSYLLLLSGIKNDPYSVEIMKDYSLAALNVGRTEDAVSVYETLRFKLDEEEFRKFDEAFQQRVIERDIMLPVF